MAKSKTSLPSSAIWVFPFYSDMKSAPGKTDAERLNLLGGKSAHLMEMCQLSLPVPPGFTLSTELCRYFYDNNRSYPKNLTAQVDAALTTLEKKSGKKFGDLANPLLVSVRSGARVSMPGMMDTVLNLGLNDQTVFGLIKTSQNERFAFDCYRRFIQMYGNVVLHIDHHEFEQILDYHKLSANVARDNDLTAAQLKSVAEDYKKLVLKKTGRNFPQNARDQLWGAIGAVFGSWQNARAKTYRRINNIPEEWGTAVTVQCMVFGNLGDDCATGVCFTRNPSTGENILYGEYLINAQGEDVVAGIRTPQPIVAEKNHHVSSQSISDHPLAKHLQNVAVRGLSMQEAMPKLYQELQSVRGRLEKHYRDMQDIEFTIERGKLYLLQTRSGKRTAAAAIKIAADMVAEKIIDKKTAVMRVEPQSVDQLLHPRLDPKSDKVLFAKGLPASPGAASGILCFSADDAEDMTHKGHSVILARAETSPEDIHGMHAAKGIVTTRGGMTSHAAVVARGMGRPCVVGVSAIRIDYAAGVMTAGGKQLRAGDWVTMDGATGEIIVGQVPMIQPEMTGEFAKLMAWADELRTVQIRANADTPNDAKIARNFGAEGIGLCRTEHMFFEGNRIAAMREMILASTTAEREKALAKLLPLQRADFTGIFGQMAGLPVTIRLLDPPLHEFLPHGEKEIAEVAASSGIPAAVLRERVHQLAESNPMLGLRGCRLAVIYPEIYTMQVRAIIESAIAVKQSTQQTPLVEIMIPLVAGEEEYALMHQLVKNTADMVCMERKVSIEYQIGSMIELPRAALRARQLAESGCQFFSFGTNDLTQTAMGLSRDDAGSFLPEYQKCNIFPRDPFVSIDRIGVGELIEIAVERGRSAAPKLKIGVCGEHGGDPQSIEFFVGAGLNYVSCSPYRVPVARLAAAHACIRAQNMAVNKSVPVAVKKSSSARKTRSVKIKVKAKSKTKSAKRRAA